MFGDLYRCNASPLSPFQFCIKGFEQMQIIQARQKEQIWVNLKLYRVYIAYIL